MLSWKLAVTYELNYEACKTNFNLEYYTGLILYTKLAFKAIEYVAGLVSN